MDDGQGDEREHGGLRDEPCAQPLHQPAVRKGSDAHGEGAQREQQRETIACAELVDEDLLGRGYERKDATKGQRRGDRIAD